MLSRKTRCVWPSVFISVAHAILRKPEDVDDKMRVWRPFLIPVWPVFIPVANVMPGEQEDADDAKCTSGFLDKVITTFAIQADWMAGGCFLEHWTEGVLSCALCRWGADFSLFSRQLPLQEFSSLSVVPFLFISRFHFSSSRDPGGAATASSSSGPRQG